MTPGSRWLRAPATSGPRRRAGEQALEGKAADRAPDLGPVRISGRILAIRSYTTLTGTTGTASQPGELRACDIAGAHLTNADFRDPTGVGRGRYSADPTAGGDSRATLPLGGRSFPPTQQTTGST